MLKFVSMAGPIRSFTTDKPKPILLAIGEFTVKVPVLGEPSPKLTHWVLYSRPKLKA